MLRVLAIRQIGSEFLLGMYLDRYNWSTLHKVTVSSNFREAAMQELNSGTCTLLPR